MNLSKAMRKALLASWMVVQGLPMESERARVLALGEDPMVRKGGIQIAPLSGKAASRGVERQTQDQLSG